MLCPRLSFDEQILQAKAAATTSNERVTQIDNIGELAARAESAFVDNLKGTRTG
jgi:hypothetical protein